MQSWENYRFRSPVLFWPKWKQSKLERPTDNSTDIGTFPNDGLINCRHWRVRLTSTTRVATKTGGWYILANCILVSHTHQRRTEAGNDPQRMSCCGIGSAVIATIPRTQLLHFLHRLWGEMVPDISRSKEQSGKVLTPTSRVRLWGSPPSRYQIPSTQWSVKIKDGRAGKDHHG